MNFDDSILRQGRLFSKFATELVGLKDMGPSVRFWMSGATRRSLALRLGRSTKNALTFVGSGDFHHVSAILLRELNERCSLISFDFHPDWDSISPVLTCGSWIADALRNPSIQKVILVGISAGDLKIYSIQSAPFGHFAGDRLEVYPYAGRATTVYCKRVPENISIETKGSFPRTRIVWNELCTKNLTEFFLHIVRRLPGRKVYVSVDKDCLKKMSALTNWEEGRMDLEELLMMLKMVKENCDVIGADVCGDYSPIVTKGALKGLVSRFDHPKNYSARSVASAQVTRMNEDTNVRIAEMLLQGGPA